MSDFDVDPLKVARIALRDARKAQEAARKAQEAARKAQKAANLSFEVLRVAMSEIGVSYFNDLDTAEAELSEQEAGR